MTIRLIDTEINKINDNQKNCIQKHICKNYIPLISFVLNTLHMF